VDVIALFELPVPIWAMCDALDTKYPTGWDALRFNIAMPEGQPPVGRAPSVLGVEARPGVGEQVVWVTEYASFIPDSLRLALEVSTSTACRSVLTPPGPGGHPSVGGS
jgi:hypothetical protein